MRQTARRGNLPLAYLYLLSAPLIAFASASNPLDTAAEHSKFLSSPKECSSVAMNVAVSSQRDVAPERIILALATLLETPVRSIAVASSRRETDLAEMLTKDGWLHNRHGFLEHQFTKWLPNNLGRKGLGGSARKVSGSLGGASATGASASETPQSWNVLELRLGTCQPRETQAQLGSLIRSGDLLAALESALVDTATMDPDPAGVSTVLVMMHIDHVEDIIRQGFQQTSDSSDGRTISSLVFEQTSLSLFDTLRTMVALIAVASVAIAALVYLIVDLCPLCNEDEEPEQFIAASQPLLSKCGNYEPVEPFPAEPSATVGRVPKCFCNNFMLKSNTRAKIVRLLRLGKVPKA